MLLVCCPYCFTVLDALSGSDEPFHAPEACEGCGRDPRRDAPIELRPEALSALRRTPCRRCDAPVPTMAVCCPQCGTARADTSSRLESTSLLEGVSGRLVAQSGNRVAFHGLGELVLVDFGTNPPTKEREIPVAWQRSVAISFNGSLAFVADDGVHLGLAGHPEVANLGVPDGLDVETVGFVGETPIAFPGVRSADDASLVPRFHGDGAWQSTGLPEGEGWTDVLDLWQLHGLCVPLARDQACVLWDGRMYLANEASTPTFDSMPVARLRTESRHAAAVFAGDLIVISGGRLVRIGLQGIDTSFVSPASDVRKVLPAPFGAVLAWCKELGDIVVWPDGQFTSLAELLGPSGDHMELFAAADRICLRDASSDIVRAAPWSDLVVACGRAIGQPA